METLCEYIILNADYKIDEKISNYVISYNELYDLDNCVDIISNYLNIDKNTININIDNLYIQCGIVLSFKFKNRECQIYKHYGSKIDYLCVSIMHVE